MTIKNELLNEKYLNNKMDDPKTRRETKKTDKEKKGGPYSSKHIRNVEKIQSEKRKSLKTKQR